MIYFRMVWGFVISIGETIEKGPAAVGKAVVEETKKFDYVSVKNSSNGVISSRAKTYY